MFPTQTQVVPTETSGLILELHFTDMFLEPVVQ